MINICITIALVALSSFLWRVRGGLSFKGKKAPANKVWYAVFVAICSSYYFNWSVNEFVKSLIYAYSAYQLFGFGKYLGALCNAVLNKDEKECELIDDLIDPCKIKIGGKVYNLNDYPTIYGFCGTTLTGLIISFVMFAPFGSLIAIFSGLGMGACYGLATLFCHIFKKADGKNAWNLGEWIFGAYLGYIISLIIL